MLIASKIKITYNQKDDQSIHTSKIYYHVPVCYIEHKASVMTKLLVPFEGIIIIIIIIIVSKIM